jgi:DNA polymerase-3 subunit beta
VAPPEVAAPVELVVEARDLLKALTRVREVIPKRRSLPIIQYAHLVVRGDGGATTIEGTDLEQAIMAEVPGVTFLSGSACSVMLPVRAVLAFLNGLMRGVKKQEKKPVHVKVEGRTLSLEAADVGCGEWADLPDPDSFPPLNRQDEVEKYTACNGEELLAAFRYVFSATAREDTRPVLTSVGVSNHAFVAADGFRLHVYESPTLSLGLPDECDAAPVLIPRAVLVVLQKLFKGVQSIDCGFVRGVKSNRVWFKAEGLTLASSLVMGSFPNWRQLIPKDIVSKVTFSAPLMLQRLDMLDQDVGIIRLEANPPAEGENGMKLIVKEDGRRWKMHIPGVVEAETKIRVAFNPVYFRDALRSFSLCTMGYCSPSSPGVFTGEIKGLMVVLMPMFVQW